jgi:hypothetical protein
MKRFLRSILLLVALGIPAFAEERTMTPEQMEALAKSGDFTGEEDIERPKDLPDLTKGGVLLTGKSAPPIWTYGPTGIVGQMAGREKGDQILVHGTLKGSPSEGKFLPGDVILGVNGRKFTAGGHMGVEVRNAIIDAEKHENSGKIRFIIWRDKNHLARIGKQEMAAVDIDKLFNEARDDNSLYDWKPEDERSAEVKQMGFDKFPIDAINLEIELKLRTFPAYAESAPYDCPKTKQILEEAWKVLEKKFVVDPKDPKSGKGGIIEAIALVASGKTEHRELVKQWVRSKHSPWNPPTEPIGEMFKPGYKGYKGFQSWHKGFAGLYCAIYYDATGDEHVLPALRKYAIETAMGQSWAGTWGHTFAFPSFNGGKLHQMNPGYGALNAAGNRCFFLITLAQKLGVKDPEVDAAVERSRRFFGSYTDQGCIPYGDHPAAGSDDSNGKNSGVAYSMKLLGDNHKAKYFAMMSSHCAFTRRGGHAHDYHGNWSSWAANLCGPEVRKLNERNMRWYRTLCRMHDGSFVANSPGGYGTLRDPTATDVLHQSVIFGQTIITGKDADESLHPNDREMKQLIASARGQFSDPMLLEMAGKPWPEWNTNEVSGLLDIFYPKARDAVAKELGKRFQAGEKDILPKMLELLGSKEPRFRDGALRALGACGGDTVLQNLSKIVPLLQDSEDFVRITAINVISKATDDKDTQLAMLQATVAESKAIAPNSVRNATGDALFGKDHLLAKNPFDVGFDETLVGKALEDVLLTDPGGANFLSSRAKVWSKETVQRIAGVLTFIAEEEQIADQMFGNRSLPARALLEKFNYREAAESGMHRLRLKSELPWRVRPFVGYKDPLVDPLAINANPGAFREDVGFYESAIIDNPNETVTFKDDRTGWKPVNFELDDLLTKIEAAKDTKIQPSLAAEVREMFEKELAALDGSGARIKACRAELADLQRKNTFRKLAAMDTLVELSGPDAMEDLTPYFAHDYWRLRDHSRELGADLVKSGGGKFLETLASSDDSRIGILAVFAQARSKDGASMAASMLKHENPVVRAAAIRAHAAINGTAVISETLSQLASSREPEALLACEDALLSFRDDSAASAQVRDGLIKQLPQLDAAVKPSAWFILVRLADQQSIAALEKAAKTDSLSELDDIVLALSYSPSRAADKLLLDIAASDKKAAAIVGPHAVRRMVLGPKGYGDITNTERMEFAEPMLKLDMDKNLIAYLGGVLDARALRALMYCLEKGVSGAAQSLVSNAERLENLKPSDSEVAVKAVRDVIEYIEVTHLRGGVQAHMDKESNYVAWKDIQARAGKALLKLHQPEKAPIPDFDPLDLDN